MSRQDIPFSQRPYSTPLTSLGAEELNNFLVELATSETSKSRYYYVGIPGLKLLKKYESNQFSYSSSCRGIYTTSNNITYAVFGNNIVQVTYNTGSGTALYILLGNLLTTTGIVRFTDNGDTVFFVDGKYGYTISTLDNSFSRITDESFPGSQTGVNGPRFCATIDTYFICDSANTRNYYWSAPGYVPTAFDSTAPTVLSLWNGLDYGEKLGDSDNIIGMIQTVNLLWVFGQQSIEIHKNTALGDDASGSVFGRVDGCFINFGCSAPASICKYGNSVYWLSSDKTGTVGIFAADSGFQPKRISTRGVETRIQKYSDITDCYSFVYSHNGHSFIIFQFPHGTATDNQPDVVSGATWVYDITNDTWTRRTFWDKDTGLSSLWQGNFSTYNWGKVILADKNTNALYYLDSNTYENDNASGTGTNMIERTVTSPIGYMTGKNVVYRTVQLQLQPGQGLDNNNSAGIGQDPQVEYYYSNDSGFSWGNGRVSSFGQTGQYAYRCRWVKCGYGRNRVHKFRITDPVFVAVIALTVDVEVLNQ